MEYIRNVMKICEMKVNYEGQFYVYSCKMAYFYTNSEREKEKKTI